MAEEAKEVKVKKKIISTDVDLGNGKLMFTTEGYANGEKLKLTIDGKDAEVEINENHGFYASGKPFEVRPGVKING